MIHPSPLSDGVFALMTSKRRQLESAMPLVALVAAGLGVGLLGGWLESKGPGGDGLLVKVVHAGGGVQLYDYDNDGLTNLNEDVLGTSPFMSDTDQDGYPDIEELARHSDADDPTSIPLPGNQDIAMLATGESDGLRIQIASYSSNGDFSDKNIEVGAVVNGQIRMLPGALAQTSVQIRRGDASNVGGGVLLIDFPFPETLVHRFGQVSLFATMNVDGSAFVDGAAAVDLVSRDNVPMIILDGPERRMNLFQSQQIGGGGIGGTGSGGSATGSVYKPIPPGGGGVPTTWTPGEICFQASIRLSDEGGVVTHEVVAADCITGWDANCRDDCASSVGGTFQTFDPLGLVGG